MHLNLLKYVQSTVGPFFPDMQLLEYIQVWLD